MGWWPFTKRNKRTSNGRTLVVRAKFDSAQTTPDNRRHWANADGLSADAAANPEIRRTLRNRARYEVANNSYARGIVLTLANDVIGTGPRLQMLSSDAEINRQIEAECAVWAKAVDLPGKLRTMRQARAQDGEAFAVLFNNDYLDSPVKLDLKLIEADQVATPNAKLGIPGAAMAVDGIEFDPFGNPIAYHVLKSHPGSGAAAAMNYDRVPANSVIHWFRADRPGQRRGLPDILPALPLFAQLRRYTLAVIAAAESAANVAIFMKTNAPAGGEAAEVEPMATMEFEPNMAVFGPEGWEPSQIKAEQPATTYDMFKREILNKIKINDFAKMTVTNKTKVLTEVGMGAPRPEEWVQGGDMVTLGAGSSLASISNMSGTAKAFWKQYVTPQGRLMAVRAARSDAMRRLAERIKGVFITSDTTVQDFVAESDEINVDMTTFLAGARETGVRYHDDELIVEVKMAVKLQTVYGSLKSWGQAHYKGDKVKIQKLEKLTLRSEDKIIEEVGMGVPPEKYLNPDFPDENHSLCIMRRRLTA